MLRSVFGIIVVSESMMAFSVGAVADMADLSPSTTTTFCSEYSPNPSWRFTKPFKSGKAHPFRGGMRATLLSFLQESFSYKRICWCVSEEEKAFLMAAGQQKRRKIKLRKILILRKYIAFLFDRCVGAVHML